MIPSETITSYQTECAMNKKYIVRLADEERRQLAELTRKGKAAAYKIRHANILLKADANGPAWTDERIAESFSVSVNTVLGVRQRLVEQGLEAALNRKKQARPSRSPLLDGAGEARLIALRCSAPPTGHGRWTLRLLADQAVALEIVEAISHETVRQVLKKMR
jgi:transposase